MKTPICIFEDELTSNFYPLVYTRPVYDLRCGILTIKEKLEKVFGKVSALHCRKYLEAVLIEKYPGIEVNNFSYDLILFVNGRLVLDKNIVKGIKSLKENELLLSGNIVIAGKLAKNKYQSAFSLDSDFPVFDFSKIKCKEISAKLFNYPWELVNENGKEIKRDFQSIVNKSVSHTFKNVVYKNKKEIFIDKSVTIDPFVFLDASNGPIFIDSNVHIMSHTLIQGPCFIGESSTIKSHSKIYHDTSIGPVCKIGGEVEASIIHSYSNKQHEGFLGHSYLGSWVNLGADTNNSDLKNNYANISVLLNGKPVVTNSMFVGLIMGDHSKTAINTMFNTGTIVGVSCNVFGSGFPPRYIPSFSWGGSDFLKTYNLDKTLEVARIVTGRRNKSITKSEEEILKTIFELTKQERKK